MDDAPLQIDEQHKALLARRLLSWFDKHARDLPWRRTSDLYRIWVSEIMLQQTQVATVIGFYERFIAEFPTVQALAAAAEERVLRFWEGLGYYRRARQLHAAARRVVGEFGGQFPTEVAAVRSLPGIGRYTAGAILSIGRDERLPILEANTIRLLSRLTLYRGDTASTAGQRHLWAVAEAILPGKRAGAFNQALMELGSEICTPRAPRCEECPIAAACPTRALGLQDAIPAAKKRTAYEDLTEVAVVIRRRGAVLVRQCSPGERWAGLWDFPRVAIDEGGRGRTEEIAAKVAALTGVTARPQELLTTIKHGVTRYRITLHCYAARYVSARRSPALAGVRLQWLRPHELHDLPLSVTGRQISRLIGAS